MSSARTTTGNNNGKGGFIAMPNHVFDTYGPQLGAHGLAVLLALLRHRDPRTGLSFPSQERIARLTGMSSRQVIREIAKLLAIGLITREDTRPGENNCYVVHIGPLTGSHLTPDTQSPDPCQPVTRPLTDSHTNNNQEQDPRTSARATDNHLNGNALLEEPFRQLVAAYPPHKIGREEEARAAFLGLQPSEASFEAMLRALNHQKQSQQWQEEDGRYVPQLADWLNKGRYKSVSGDTGITARDRAKETKQRMERSMNHGR